MSLGCTEAGSIKNYSSCLLTKFKPRKGINDEFFTHKINVGHLI